MTSGNREWISRYVSIASTVYQAVEWYTHVDTKTSAKTHEQMRDRTGIRGETHLVLHSADKTTVHRQKDTLLDAEAKQQKSDPTRTAYVACTCWR